MKRIEKTDIVEGVDIPTREARKAIKLLWKGLDSGEFEFKDMLLFATFIFSLIGMIASIFK